MGNGTACMFLAHSSQLWGRRRQWDHNFISGPLRFFGAPQFYQWTFTVSVHGYLFQEVRDWISNWREVVFVRKRLFFSILSPVNDHSSKKEKDGTFRFWDFSFFYLLYLLWFFRLVFYLAKPLICYENVITVTEIWDRAADKYFNAQILTSFNWKQYFDVDPSSYFLNIPPAICQFFSPANCWCIS